MPFEDARSHFEDILASIRVIERFVHGMDLEAYRLDEKTQAAVERKMLIISEAAIRLKGDAEAMCPGCRGGTFVGAAIGCGINTTVLLWKRSGTRFRMTCRHSRLLSGRLLRNPNPPPSNNEMEPGFRLDDS
jgi:hypothetical protein